jgi:hypothetical protein
MAIRDRHFFNPALPARSVSIIGQKHLQYALNDEAQQTVSCTVTSLTNLGQDFSIQAILKKIFYFCFSRRSPSVFVLCSVHGRQDTRSSAFTANTKSTTQRTDSAAE